MFEQESGQVLIDRRRHEKALQVLMFYGFVMPRVHEDLAFVWGDKDLFRLAWLKTNSSFHMIERPAGSTGVMDVVSRRFCGVTMVQHDPHGEIVFFHRNTEKLGMGNTNKRLWKYVQEFKPGASLDRYHPEYAQGFGAVRGSCWGKTSGYEGAYIMGPISDFKGFSTLEDRLIGFVNEALGFMKTK